MDPRRVGSSEHSERASMLRNKILEKWAQGEAVCGTVLSLGSTRSAEICARAGFDFLMVDAQHGYFDEQSSTDAIRAIESAGAVPFARVARNDPGRIGTVLDAGALGVVVPMVNSREEAEAAVRATYYPPQGLRSKGGTVATYYGAGYHATANNLVALVVMVETAHAVENIGEIIRVEGVRACLIGSGDLALSLGCGLSDAPILRAVDAVAAACKTSGTPLGITTGSLSAVERWRSLGVSFILVSHDVGALCDAMGSLAQRARAALQG